MLDRRKFRVNGLEIEAEFQEADREKVFLPLLERLTTLQKAANRRLVVFLGAPPAAGKSTLCCYLEALSREKGNLTPVQCVGIDGFHHYQEYLDSHFIEKDGLQIPLARIKGAPESYDVAKMKRLLRNVQADGQRWPLYDRRIHNPVEEAVEIREKILILEGNWLLLDEAPWNELECDYSIFIAAGDRSQLERIVRRKMMGGFSEEHAREIVEKNDWPNIIRCMENSRRANLNLKYNPEGKLEEI